MKEQVKKLSQQAGGQAGGGGRTGGRWEGGGRPCPRPSQRSCRRPWHTLGRLPLGLSTRKMETEVLVLTCRWFSNFQKDFT